MINKEILIKSLNLWFSTKYDSYHIVDSKIYKSLYLFNIDEEYADYRIFKDDGTVFYNVSLRREFSQIFPGYQSEFESLSYEFLKNKLKLNNLKTPYSLNPTDSILKIHKNL